MASRKENPMPPWDTGRASPGMAEVSSAMVMALGFSSFDEAVGQLQIGYGLGVGVHGKILLVVPEGGASPWSW